MSQVLVRPAVYVFGPFRADLQSCELQKHGIRVHVQLQPIRMLGPLVEHAGRLVTRQEIVDRLWPGRRVDEFDDNLNATMTKLREALGDDAGKPLYVETVPRRGYRFIAPVEAEAPEVAVAEVASAAVLNGDAERGAQERESTGLAWNRIVLAAVLLTVCGIVLGALISRYTP